MTMKLTKKQGVIEAENVCIQSNYSVGMFSENTLQSGDEDEAVDMHIISK